MRTAGNKRTEATQGQPNICHNTKATKGANTAPLTQAELLAWWPFTRLDPKRFPKTVRNHDVEDALL